MAFCTGCGRKLSEEDYFCSKCGTVTRAGRNAGAAGPLEDVRQTLAKVGEEIGRTFTVVAQQAQKAFAEASSELKQKLASTKCQHCGAENPVSSRFCEACGKSLGQSK